MKYESGRNVYEKIAGKVAGSSVALAAVVLIFGGAGRDAIGGVAILCAFGLLVALMNKKSSCCSCCDCGCQDKESKTVSITAKSAKKGSKKKSKKK